MNTTSLRTQIILPKSLRAEIDRQRMRTGESMAEYLRNAAKDRLAKEKKKKADLKKLAEEVVGSAKGTRTEKEIREWIKKIRKDREEDDAHVMKRLGVAHRKSSGQQT